MMRASRQAGWRQGWTLVLAGFLPIVAIIALAPALPTLIAHFADVPYARVMVPLLLTVPSACIALLSPVAGLITDRLGRRTLILASMLLYGVGGVVPFMIDSFWLVVCGRLLIGVAEAGILTVTNALMADYFDEQARRRWLAAQAISGSLLGSGLLVFSGWLASIGWQWPFIVYAAAFPLLICGYLWLYEPERSVDKNVAANAAGILPFPVATMLAVCAVTLLLSTIYFVQPIHFSLVLKEMGVSNPRDIGLISAVPSFGVPIGGVLFYLTGRFGSPAQLILTFILYAIGLSGIGMAGSINEAMAFGFVQQLGSGVVVAALIAWAQSKLIFEHRGRGMGFWATSFFVAQFVSPAVVAAVSNAANGLRPAFVAFGVLAAVSAVAGLIRLWFVRRRAS